MDDVRARWLRPDDGALQTPVAHLVCNFARGRRRQAAAADARRRDHPVPRVRPRPAPHADAGRTSATSPASAASNGTRSSCPASSWRTSAGNGTCCEHMTAHVDTGEPLPRELFDKMIAAKNFQSGLQTLRQIEFALFDMLLHTEHDPAQDFMPLLRRGARRGRGDPAARLQPHGAHFQPHLRRRLRGRLLQLQVGRGAERRCLCRLRGDRR